MDPRIAERGFCHAWTSRVGEGNGEDFFRERLARLVGADDVVLDVGCGHGELVLDVARRCRMAIGVDRDAGYLSLASELAEERGVANARFVEFAFAAGDAARGSRLRLQDTVTVVVNRRGPTADKWLAEVRRLARPASAVLVMHPAGRPPRPEWIDELPPALQDCFGCVPFDQVRSWVETPLAAEHITDYRLWWFDVPEWFTTAEDLYRRLVGHRPDPPELAAVSPALRRVVARHADANGLPLRHQRLVAQFRLPTS